jgi:guanylate kinase
MAGAILVLSGPSGCGKSSLVTQILKEQKDVYFSISTTTRAMRAGEAEGVDYHFISKDTFESEIQEGEFLEWAKVHDNYYGTSLKAVKKALGDDKLVIFDIDVQGHEIVKKQFDDILTSLFITTPNSNILKSRLLGRGTDSTEVIDSRLLNSRQEMERLDEYDFLLVNDNFDDSLEKFRSIVGAARMKVDKKRKDIFINRWYNS